MNVNDIVVTSRIRLARNLEGFVFASKLRDIQGANEIIDRVYSCLKSRYCFHLVKISEITDLYANQLKEKYVISESLRKNIFSGAVAIGENDISIMINEEDHLREQCLEKGLNLTGAYKRLANIDSWLNLNLNFCKSESLGYITACPTNLGTGLRASAMMFLPTLSRCDKLKEILVQARQRGLTIRGAFGEGSYGDGFMYQISNEITLGKSCKQIIEEVEQFVNYVYLLEQSNCLTYYEQNKIVIEDEVFRALALLTNCKILGYDECVKLISSLKLGAILDIIKVNDINNLDNLLVTSRPNLIKGLLQDNQENCSVLDIEVSRANYVNNAINDIVI